MATTKTYFSTQNYRFISTDHHHSSLTTDSGFELEESDIYNFSTPRSNSPEFRNPPPSSRIAKKGSSKRLDVTPSSLPVNIPDWSTILKDQQRDNRRTDNYEDEDDEIEGGVRIPPHEFLARQMARNRTVSFSVHEGIGRTLKGRDLSRVRNAIWEKTGFED